MSTKKITEVWESDISAPWQQILLAMADIADDDGNSLFPSVGYLSWKTGKSERQIRALLADLREAKVLTVSRPSSQHYPTHYHLDPSVLPKKTSWEILRELKRQSRGEISAGLGKSQDDLSTGREKSRDEKTAGLRPEKTASLENPDLQFSAPDLQFSVARPAASFILSGEIRQLEEEGEGEKPASTSDFSKWSEEDHWLRDFLKDQRLLTVPAKHLLANPIWWTSVGVACGGLNVEWLTIEFAKIAAYLLEHPEKSPKGRRGWLRLIRSWLIRENRWREEDLYAKA